MNAEEQAKALFFRAQDARKHGQHAEAEMLLREAMHLVPERSSIRINLCGALIDQGKYAEALPYCLTLVEEEPARGVCWHRLSLCQTASGLAEAALVSIDRCIELEPQNLDAISHKIALLLDGNDMDGALDWALRAVRIAPDNAASHTALGVVHRVRREFEKALECNMHAAELAPGDPDKLWNLSLVQLMLGDYANGWQSMEARWTMSDPVSVLYEGDAPRWDGDDAVRDQRLLVWGEQGLGDCLQFVRYLPVLAQITSPLTLQIPAALYPLLKDLAGVNVVTSSSALPPHALQVPLLSLPHCLGSDAGIPAPLALSAPAVRCERWRARLGSAGLPRVGLMWQGNPDNLRGLHRSLPVAQLQDWLDLPLEFHCVSNHVSREDAAWIRQHGEKIRTHADGIDDFADTAALLQSLDLLITIDTSLAHLGPSLQLPTWVLLSWEADWRWGMQDVTPWYPQSRLFRQQRRGDWGAPVKAVRSALQAHFSLAD